MKLRYQGFVLIAFPLVCQMLFVGILIIETARLDSAASREARAKQIINICGDLTTSLHKKSIALLVMRLRDSPKFEATVDSTFQATRERLDYLEELAKKEPHVQRLLNQYVSCLRHQLILLVDLKDAYSSQNKGQAHFAHFLHEGEFYEELFFYFNRMAGLENEIIECLAPAIRELDYDEVQMRRNAISLVITGVVFSVIFGLILTVYFGRNTNRRLDQLMANIESFSVGNLCLEKAGGTDEIAVLDQRFREVALACNASDELRRSILAMVSHDMQTPLKSIEGSLGMALKRLHGELDPRLDRVLSRVHSEVLRLVRLSNDLLDTEGVESSSIKLDIEHQLLKPIVDQSIGAVLGMADAKHVSVRNDVSGEIFLSCDANRIIQVLVNFLSNAVKFAPRDSEVLVRARILNENELRVEVVDRGPGIPEESQALVFEKFKQLLQSGERSSQGSGLGLAICKALIEKHAGKIGVESVSGKGSCFWFSLPTGNVAEIAATSDCVVYHTGDQYASDSAEPQCEAIGFRWLQRRIRNQALFLVCLPLVCQIIFVGTLASVLANLDSAVSREEHAKKVISTSNEITSLVAKDLGLEVLRLVGNSRLSVTSINVGDSAREHVKSLKKLVKDDPVASEFVREYMDILTELAQRVTAMKTLYEKGENAQGMAKLWVQTGFISAYRSTVTKLVAQQRLINDRYTPIVKEFQPKAARERELLAIIAIGGVCTNSLVTLLLAIYFGRNIVTRLNLLMANVESFSSGKLDFKPVAGHDEIFTLNQRFQQIATARHRSEQIRRSILATVSHDIRTPLSSVQGILMMALKRIYGEVEPGLEKVLSSINSDALRLIRLSNDLLDSERIESGSIDLKLENHFLETIVYQSINAIRGMADAKFVSIKTDIPSEMTIYCDCDRIIQVLINLLSNAVKFSDANAPVLLRAFVVESAEQDIGVYGKGRMVRVEVSDRGPGIAKQRHKDIFDKFNQLAQSGQTTSQGSGLGLAICKALIEKHNGVIGVESDSGEGCSVWFELPMPEVASTN